MGGTTIPKISFTQSLIDRMGTVGQLLRMLGVHGHWWAIPAFVLLILLGLVLVGLQAIPYVAPFIYTVF